MQANPLWPVTNRFPALEKDLRKEVVVVGGGMAGVATAYHLKRAGFDVAVLERDEVGGPATGASSGVLYYGSGTNYAPAVKLFGRERADSLWKETAKVIQDIVELAGKEKIECGLRTCGSIMVAKTDAEIDGLEDEHNGMTRVGLPAKLLSGSDVKNFYPKVKFVGGVTFDAVAQVHPARLAAGVALAHNIEIYENTACLDLNESEDEVVIRTAKGEVRALQVVLATNTEACLGFENDFELESSVILASGATNRVAEFFPTEKIIWTMEDKYDIIYPRGDRLILELYALGEEEARLAYYYPGVDFAIEHQWGEVWAKPPDLIPIVGKATKRTAVAVGMGDQGIIMSWLSGSKMPKVMKGERDWFTEMAFPGRFAR